ncbi:hypothetical protein CMI47_02335 [Candidatus Pacearchaeota archaeon]|nr:hypothetical protein [Candidatus Pacearchaeota archaeon]|tara:strand:- start:200 stop:379 length:180 start_codon:yes stop_codon:yes gene_type:complete
MNVVCEHCKESVVEKNFKRFDINFFEKKIHWFCLKCKKINTLDLSREIGGSYPRIKIRR